MVIGHRPISDHHSVFTNPYFTMTNIRQERIARLLFEELSIIIGSELSDPSLSLVSVTDVNVSRDLRNAKVFVSHDNDEVSKAEVLQGLKRALPYTRSEIASRIGLRMAPELYFAYDDTPARAERIDAIIEQIASERDASDDDLSSDDQSMTA